MPLKVSEKVRKSRSPTIGDVAKRRRSTTQKRIVPLCPFMSRRITHRDWEGNPVEELVRQPCVGDDCELWDKGTEHCSLRRRKL